VRLLLLLAACSFDVRGVAVEFPDLSAAVDLAEAADLPAGPDLLQPDLTLEPDLAGPAFCPQISSLVACYRFNDALHPTMLQDDSMYANHATATGASFPAGVNGAALTLSANGSARVSDRPSLDISEAISLEVWVKSNSLVQPMTSYGVLDDDSQYGIFLMPGGRVQCTLAGVATVTSPNNAVVVGTWQHVACTYDRQVARLYVGGHEVMTAGATRALATNGTNGLALASNSPSGSILDGEIDDLRIWSIALDATQICTDAGAC
jgi:hypothetical protein